MHDDTVPFNPVLDATVGAASPEAEIKTDKTSVPVIVGSVLSAWFAQLRSFGLSVAMT
jgi:hypothetical protein